MSAVITISSDQAQAPLFVGIDVGGTSVKLGVVDDLGRSLGKTAVPTHEDRGPAEAFGRVMEALRLHLASLGKSLQEVAAIGVGAPGPQDIPQGIIIAPDNLPHWRNFAVVQFVREATGKPVAFANDGNAAAFGECWVGSGRAYHIIVMFTLGTGVGGGIIIGDTLIEGDHSHGGELGHIVIDMNDDALLCNSGRGHLEAYASATAVIHRTEAALAAGVPTALREQLAAGAVLTPLLLMQAAEQGDAFSYRMIMETADYLGVGAVSLMHTIDPGAVIIGGAMTFGGHDHAIGREFLERVRAMVRRRAFPIPAARTVIDFAQLGGDAGYIGAAGIARTAYHKGLRSS
jgi:glucokinase